MTADLMNLQAKNELLKERINIMEEAIKEALNFDDRQQKNVSYSFDHRIIFDILQKALDRQREIAT